MKNMLYLCFETTGLEIREKADLLRVWSAHSPKREKLEK